MGKIVFICIFSILVLFIHADFDAVMHDFNDVNAYISNYGMIAHDASTTLPGLYWPSGYPSETYAYGGGLWIGGLVDAGGSSYDTIVAFGYNPMTGNTDFMPGDLSSAPLYDSDSLIVYMSDSSNNGYDWPLKNSAMRDSVISGLDSYAEFYKVDSAYDNGIIMNPLGVKIIQNGYQWGGPLKDCLVLKFKIINIRTDMKDIEQCYLGAMFDFDIGDELVYHNDLLGFIDTMTVDYGSSSDTLMQINTMYQFQLPLEPGWSHKPAKPSVTMLESPIANDTVDLYHDGSFLILPGEELGMTSCRFYSITNDPDSIFQKYLNLAGYDHVTYNPAFPESSFIPFPDWGFNIMGFPGQTEDSTEAGDKRLLISSGHFTLAYGDTADFTICIMMNQASEDILPSALNIKYLWNNFNSMINLISPSNDTIISSSCSFEWSCDSVIDSFSLELLSMNQDPHVYINGINTFSYSFDPSAVVDGIYKWRVWNYDSLFRIANSAQRLITIDNPGINGRPAILSLTRSMPDYIMKVKWDARDPESSSILSRLIFARQSTGDTVVDFWTWADSALINAYTLLPNDAYSIFLIAYDDSMASDTASTFADIAVSRPADSSSHYSGNADCLDISVAAYHSSEIKFDDYYVLFDWPFIAGNNIYLPYEVFDSSNMSIALQDSACFSLLDYTSQDYVSPVFDGIGLIMSYTNDGTGAFDSVTVESDVGTIYPESLLSLNPLYPSFAGRNMILNWHWSGDSLYADIIPENYSDMLEYDTSTAYSYYYGSSSNKTDYIWSNTSSRTLMYAAGCQLYFNKPGRAYEMDTLWVPGEGEIWKLFSSGSRIPIKGDVYSFTPSGISEFKSNTKGNMYRMSIDSYINRGNFILSIPEHAENCCIVMYDLQGRIVSNITNQTNNAGTMNIESGLPNGIYFIRDMNNVISNTLKITILH